MVVLVLVATTLGTGGDAVARWAIYAHLSAIRLGLVAAGGVLLLGYGSFLNIAPLECGRGIVLSCCDAVPSVAGD